MTTEEWRDVKGYEGRYQVSNLGNVKRLAHQTAYTKSKNNTKVLKILSDKDMAISLHKSTGYLRTSVGSSSQFLHRLLAEAFIDNPDSLKCINHVNGVKTDNRLENLEWCSYFGNNKHARDNMLNPLFGENNGRAKLNEMQVLTVYTLGKNKSLDELSRLFSVSKTAISRILSGRSWKHLYCVYKELCND